MSSERYVGETRALWHFLSELQPLVIATLGEDALLRHYIDRALKTGDLQRLRHARRIFHNHPDALKRQLMRGIFEGTTTGSELPVVMQGERMAPMADADEQPADQAANVVRFDAFPAAAEQDVALSVGLDSEARIRAPVQVMIKPGTLPRGAAEALRQVADWIEHDRRMLSRRHWAHHEHRNGPADETVDQA